MNVLNLLLMLIIICYIMFFVFEFMIADGSHCRQSHVIVADYSGE